jgi:hypothetical protein
MLDYVDTFLAFGVIMLGVSLIITMLTQMTSALLAARGANLRDGIATLLAALEPNLAADARTISQSVLTHPVISDSIFARLSNVPLIGVLVKRWKLATAIGPAEFKRILGLCYPASATAAAGGGGVVTVGSVVHRVTSNPEFEAWFESTMARLSQQFALHMRLWTVGFAVVLSFGVHLDSIALLDELWRDSEARSRLVVASEGMLQAARRVESGEAKEVSAEVRQIKDTLNQAGFTLLSKPWPGLRYTPQELPGLLLSALLLSLGAPFWYNQLKSVINLRPIVAGKQDK